MTTLAQTAPDRDLLLGRVIQADAVAIVAACAAALLAAGPIEAATGIPAALLQPLGVVFLVYAAGLAYTASRPTISRAAARAIMLLNFGWVALSVAALIFGWLPLTPAGFWVVAAQAAAVDLLAVAQYLGLRRAR